MPTDTLSVAAASMPAPRRGAQPPLHLEQFTWAISV
jgi:hypothetical protein